MRLAHFILRDMERILAEWEAFAATRLPAANKMTRLALRNHADKILRAIARDLSTPQSAAEQLAKSHGEAQIRADAPETAAQTHGLLRAKSGFDIKQMTSEYRALRASVLRLWFEACGSQDPHLEDIVRFNEAIDQALAESVAFFVDRVEQGRNLFLGMLGHDMRSPLQVIQMTATMLGRPNGGAIAGDAAARLVRSGQRMQALLDDLVDFNRVNLGMGIAVHRQPGDLGHLFEEGVVQLRAAHPRRRIDLQVRGTTTGSWDAASLHRVLDNLVGNALKYGLPDSPVRVIVNGEAEDVIVEVHNNGLQIDPETMDSLFEPLRRGPAQSEGERNEMGLGLGLYISREVVKAHGGDIRVSSSPDETVFVARLARGSCL